MTVRLLLGYKVIDYTG